MAKSTRILIVDDEKNMRATLTDILSDEGYQVDAVDSGEAAVERCRSTPYNVILMDVRMSGISGVDAFREIRGFGHAGRVILMSAYPLDEQKEAALEEGAAAFFPKPLNIESVVALINQMPS